MYSPDDVYWNTMTSPTHTEQWAPVGEAPDYDVSTMGRVRRRDRERVLRPSPVGRGYLQVMLAVDGRRVARYVHRLVLLAFIGEPPPYHEARHANNDRADNRLENLCWSPPRIAPGQRLTATKRQAIREARAAGESIASVAMRLGVSATAVRRWGTV